MTAEPRSVRDGLAVAACVVRLWRGELARHLGGSRLAAHALLLTLGGALVSWLGLGLLTRLSARGVAAVPVDVQRGLGSEVVLASLVVPALVATVLLVLAPTQALLDQTMAPLPAAPSARRLGRDLPLVVIGAVVDTVVLAPIVATALVLVDPRDRWGLVIVSTSAVLLGVASAHFLFAVTQRLLPQLAVAPLLGRMASALVIVGGSVGAIAAAPEIAWTASGGGIAWPVTAAVGAIAAATLAALTAAVPQRQSLGSAGSIVPSFRRLAAEAPRGRNLIGLELVRWYRSPFVLSIDATTIAATVVLVAVVPHDAPSWALLSLAIVVAAASSTAVMCGGVTRRSHWTWASSTLDRGTSATVEVSATALVAAVPLIVCSALLLVSGTMTPSALVAASPAAVLAFASALLAGVMLPVDESMGLSSVTALLLALAVDIGIGVGMSALLSSLDVEPWAPALIGALSVGLAASAILLLRRRTAAA